MSGFEKITNQSSEDVVDPRELLIKNLSELEKTKENFELEVIQDADRRTSAIMERYGMPAFTIGENQIHIVAKGDWQGDGHGFMSREIDGAVVLEKEIDKEFLLSVVHEMFHLKGVNFLPEPFTEAIVEKLSCEAINLDDSAITGENVFSGSYSYNEYREEFDKFIDKIVEGAMPRVVSRKHVFSFFAKSHLSGSLEYILFLNDIFGQGTVEKLNSLDDNFSSFQNFVNDL